MIMSMLLLLIMFAGFLLTVATITFVSAVAWVMCSGRDVDGLPEGHPALVLSGVAITNGIFSSGLLIFGSLAYLIFY
jgi:hypothetical protein